MARDAEDFPQFVDTEGYIYRIWPFENIVRYVPGGSKTMELAKVVGTFDHLAADGNMILLNGSYCPQIDGQMSATMVVKCAEEKKLDMVETSACRYHFTAFHPTICTSMPTEAPIIAPSGSPTHVPTMYSSAPTMEPTMMPGVPTINPTVKSTLAPTLAPVMPKGGKTNPDEYGHLSYLSNMELPTHEDRIKGFIYEIQPFNQVIRYIVDEHNNHNNQSLIGIFDGLDDDGKIIIRDGILCNDGSDNHLGGTISVTCGSDNVFELNKVDACTYEMNLFTDHECTGTPTSMPSAPPTQRPNTASLAPTYPAMPTNIVNDDAFGSTFDTMMPTSEATVDPNAPTVYINDPQTFWPTGGLLPCDSVDTETDSYPPRASDIGASDIEGPTLDGEAVDQIIAAEELEKQEMSIQDLYELDRKTKTKTKTK